MKGKLSPRDIMAGITTLPALPKKPRCSSPGCPNVAENKYGTCDECEDAAYQGDAFDRW